MNATIEVRATHVCARAVLVLVWMLGAIACSSQSEGDAVGAGGGACYGNGTCDPLTWAAVERAAPPIRSASIRSFVGSRAASVDATF